MVAGLELEESVEPMSGPGTPERLGRLTMACDHRLTGCRLQRRNRVFAAGAEHDDARHHAGALLDEGAQLGRRAAHAEITVHQDGAVFRCDLACELDWIRSRPGKAVRPDVSGHGGPDHAILDALARARGPDRRPSTTGGP